MLTNAIVRPPGENFAAGLTRLDLGAPILEHALQQHEAYCEALTSCGLNLIRLEPDDQYPDSTFVEDTAVLIARAAVIARPGAPSRLKEIESIKPVLHDYFSQVHSIVEPGTLDGGDVCEAGEHFFIGISDRTNEHGASQLAQFLDSCGYTSSLIDIRGVSNILHLKSGLAHLGGRRLAVIEALRNCTEFSGYDLICLSPAEEYAANCLSINGRLLLPTGLPKVKEELDQLGYKTIVLEMSEFQKMDGGLSCLSLRF
jgi:dimethylargininase